MPTTCTSILQADSETDVQLENVVGTAQSAIVMANVIEQTVITVESSGMLESSSPPSLLTTEAMVRVSSSTDFTEDLKRKRHEADDEHNAGDPATDDPLFVTKKRRRQRTVEKVKKVNAVVKQVTRKTDVLDTQALETQIPKDPEAKARGYQLEILREAEKRNTIVYLETGCGKTLIAVLRIRSLAHRLRMPDQKRLAIFLVPTVNLVRQQSCVIDCHTDLKFGEYVGHMGVDTWKPERWLEEIRIHEVLVMTPQILLDLLTHGILKLDIVEILIFDECHHATKRHPYCKIMDRYREIPVENRPKIFGMTASPVNRKGVKSCADADKQLTTLEQKLDSKVCGVKDRSELESFVPTPNTKRMDYETSTFPTEENLLRLVELAKEHEVYKDNGNVGEDFKDYEDLRKKIKKTISRLHNAILYCLLELGFLCALKAAEIQLKEDVKEAFMEPSNDIVAALKAAKDSYMKVVLKYLRDVAPKGKPTDLSAQVEAGLLTPKVKLLVEVLMNYRDVKEMRCIVFVDRVVATVALAAVINQLECLSFLRCEHLAGTSSSFDNVTRNFQQAAIEKFRSGKINLLVATNVAEEGLDVQSCHSVIRFDICKSVRSYIQSRGRARRPGSDYIVFLKKGDESELDDFNGIVQSEITMAQKALARPEELIECDDNSIRAPTESYRVECTGAELTTDSSIGFMYRFCSKLPGDKYYTPRPEFSFRTVPEALHVCTLKLPPNSPIHELTGSARRSEILAKQVVCLEAVKILHAMGAVTDHLLPVVEESKSEEVQSIKMGTNKKRGAGSKKQKELHNTIVNSMMKGSWVTSGQGVTVHAYQLTFSTEHAEKNHYASFAVLVESKLDDDVAQLKVELVLRLGRMANANFSPAGKVYLTPEQLGAAKEYQELLFNGMFSSLLTRSGKVAGSLSTRKSLVVTSDEELWNSNKMYLLLPLIQNHTARCTEPNEAVLSHGIQIDWRSTIDTALGAQQLKSFYDSPVTGSLSTPPQEDDMSNSFPSVPVEEENSMSGQDAGTSEEPDILQLAFGTQMKLSQVVDTVVLTVHTGMIYVITKVLDKSATDLFPESKEGEGKAEGKEEGKEGEIRALEEPRIRSYADYFAQKHKYPLKHPKQPLLQAKQTHRPRNLLARNSVIAKPKKKKSKGSAADEEAASVEIPPELCVILGISSSVVRSAYLIPSVMHRLDAALTANELRRVIIEDKPQCPNIPVMRIVEALTTLRCLEEFSLEGLELLGDSFLKYSTSSYLFLQFDNKHEGQLSARRCQEICNAKLHTLATSRGLPEFIRDEVFDPSYWVPPGMHCPKMMLCRCNLANLWSNQTEKADEDKNSVGEEGTKVVKIGKSCANGHRWLCSKTISDVVEALIGAFLMEGDTAGAIGFMTWAGFEVEIDPFNVERARTSLVVDPSVNIGADLQGLEGILNYSFINKGLLIEAITHASNQEVKGSFCYQRLEFLGDAVLDLLITKHLFFMHPGLTPGHLTDLRSAAVNNECFARVAVKHKFNKYLRHSSGFLLKQIEEFLEVYRNCTQLQKDTSFGWDGVKGPKVLGDLVESIAGAILVDTGFNLEIVWKVMKPLLAPIVTPETLPLHPVRELQEVCHLNDFGMLLQDIQTEKLPKVAITVDLNIQPKLFATSSHQQKKTAQKSAAMEMLTLLEGRGVWHPCKVSILGRCPFIHAVPTEDEPALSAHKRKLDDIGQGLNLGFGPEDDQEGSLEKKIKPSSALSCSATLLLTNEHKLDIESDAHVVVVPA